MDNLLITGGTGTLGHALVKRFYDECGITIFSRSELKQAQMKAQYPRLRCVLGDVRDYPRVSAAVAGHDTVIHAAAMKRIPECEAQPSECYTINVVGSDNVAHACVVNGVQRVVGISTDKACQPVTVYGATKLMMERIFQAQPESRTVFTLVRYGNVLESNGSVIPLWRRQAANGDALTITDRRMTRFWMAPSEAIAAIERALYLTRGFILVPKVKSLAIVDMARLVCGDDIPIVSVGLRSVERLHEWLVSHDEAAQETHESFIVGGNDPDDIGLCPYYSFDAPRLTRDEFNAMLGEVDA